MAPGQCCTTAAMGQEYPGAPMHDDDCPLMGGSEAEERDEERGEGISQECVNRLLAQDDESRLKYRAPGLYTSDEFEHDYGVDYVRDFPQPKSPRTTHVVVLPRLDNGPIEMLVAQLDWPVPTDWITSLNRFRAAGLTEAVMGYLVGVTMARPDVRPADHWVFFCGCCWRTLKR